ncbi:hypothetical protein BOTNAR_0307g00150 [Botryotinia narcissicola]|uniref:Uncharacterized protein n=1 Tax=Botryotinia narcissicola TaxID=278944 RepID=A0A4Z1HUZ6_9HELO|nr:hypothetical protein BOTNAR_0307g00150 [Botryotinia narcissicola]
MLLNLRRRIKLATTLPRPTQRDKSSN